MFLPLELTLRPSRIYVQVLAGAHGLALAGIWLAAMAAWVKLMMTAIVIASMVWSWRENSRATGAVRITQSGQVEILEGEWRAAEVIKQPVVLPWFVSVVFVPKGGKAKRLLLFPDSAEADGLRKLKVWLRWGSQP